MAKKIPLLKHIEQQSKAVTIRHLREPYFDPNWHFHPHFQLFTVLEGTGTRLIGDSIQPFTSGDTVLLGPDIPHLWRSDPEYYDSSSQLTTNGIVIYFQHDFLGESLLNLGEMININKLLLEAERGFLLTGSLREHVQDQIKAMLGVSDFQRIIGLLCLLQEIATSSEKSSIASIGYQNNYKHSETERMQRVHNYLLQHFNMNIKLTEVAAHAGMSSAAFCRYFKTRTGKTLSDFINELRIGHSCKLLLDDQWSIAQIAYESGFDTLSNFNRYFKKFTGKTPREYKKGYNNPLP